MKNYDIRRKEFPLEILSHLFLVGKHFLNISKVISPHCNSIINFGQKIINEQLWPCWVYVCLPASQFFSHTPAIHIQLQGDEKSPGLAQWRGWDLAAIWALLLSWGNSFSSFWGLQTLCPKINRHILSLPRKKKTAKPTFQLGGIPLLHLKKKSHPSPAMVA